LNTFDQMSTQFCSARCLTLFCKSTESEHVWFGGLSEQNIDGSAQSFCSQDTPFN